MEGGSIFLALFFTLRAFAFFGIDWWIDHRGGADRKDIVGKQVGSGSAIFIGTLLDNIPESIILGMSLALGGAINLAFLAAVFISNLPEGMAGSLNLDLPGDRGKASSGCGPGWCSSLPSVQELVTKSSTGCLPQMAELPRPSRLGQCSPCWPMR